MKKKKTGMIGIILEVKYVQKKEKIEYLYEQKWNIVL